jgi:hypothetical protein
MSFFFFLYWAAEVAEERGGRVQGVSVQWEVIALVVDGVRRVVRIEAGCETRFSRTRNK